MNVPKLRFPEFEGEWEKGKLGKFAEFKAGYAFKSELMLTIKSNYQILKMSNVYQNELRLDRNPSYWEITDDKQKEFLLKKGDTILTLTGTVGKRDYGYSVMIKEENKYLLNQRLVLLREVERKSNSGFINYLLSTEKFLFYFFLEAKGGTGNQTNVSTEDVKNICLNFPRLPEQTKIASFLTAADDKLTQLKKKKSLLEEYKKGVMQKIFSQELRFKDDNGEDFPEWEEKRLGDIAERVISKNKENNLNVLTISAQNGLISQLEFFNKSVSAKDVTGYYLLNKDDFAYNKSYSNGYPMGAIKRLTRYEKGIVSTLYICFRNKPEFDNSFAEQYFETGLQNSELEKVAQEGARNHGLLNIGVSDFFNIALQIPSLPEQTKIANFLSAIDEKINHCSKQLERMEDWKRGLLQQIFC